LGNLDLGTKKPLWPSPVYSWCYSVAISNDSTIVVTTADARGSSNPDVRIFDVMTGAENRSLKVDGGAIIGVSLSPDGKQALFGLSEDGLGVVSRTHRTFHRGEPGGEEYLAAGSVLASQSCRPRGQAPRSGRPTDKPLTKTSLTKNRGG
jgi:WD40 repeat protein